MARAVKTMATRATKKARGSRVTRVRVTRVMMETSLREEGDNGHNNQLGTKVVAMARTVVVTTARATMAAMVTTATMTPNGKDDNKNQAAMAARVITAVARATVIGTKRQWQRWQQW